MFISNIICKLPAIICKLGIIYKNYNSPYKQGPIVTLKYYKYRFHRTLYTSHHTLSTQATSLCPPLSNSLEFYLSIYLLCSLHSYSYLSVRVFYFAPSLQLTWVLHKHILVLFSSLIFLLERQSLLFCRSPLLSKVPLQDDMWSSRPHSTTSALTCHGFGFW